jgi:uncharacterized protein (DUF697 family)
MLQRTTRILGLGRYFWDTMREMNPKEIRTELERPVTIGLFGRPGSGRHTLARALFGQDSSNLAGKEISVNDVDSAAVAAAGRVDVAFLLLDATEPDWSAERRLAGRLNATGVPFFVVATHADQLPSPQQAATAIRSQFPTHPPELAAVVDPRAVEATQAQLIGPLLKAAPALRLALAHRFPTLRRAVSEELIRETAFVNAQFALMSSLPALIPVLGFVLGGMADILVLTKNQAMLVFKLAAIHGRNIDDKIGILREIVPVVGSAFLWRTIARTAVMLVPAPVAAIPKATIAYVGTYLVGQSARYYYEQGDRPPPEVLRSFQVEARAAYTRLNDQLKQRFARGEALPPPSEPLEDAS